jgi:hypothetical protein
MAAGPAPGRIEAADRFESEVKWYWLALLIFWGQLLLWAILPADSRRMTGRAIRNWINASVAATLALSWWAAREMGDF